MAHFAKLDSNKKVIAIEVVDNANLLDGNGVKLLNDTLVIRA